MGPGVLVLGLLAPFVPLLAWAVAGGYGYPALLPEPSARGARLLATPAVVEAAVTSMLVGIVVAVLATAAGTAAGRALGGHRFRGRGIVAAVLVAPVVVPALATTLGIQVFFVRYGLADTVAGVVLVQLVPAVPYASLVMAAAFARLDPDAEDQARMLGAGPWQRTRHVVAPAVAPAAAVAALFTFLISWSEYILTLLIGGGTVRTLPLVLFAAIGSGDLPAAAALSLALALPPLLLVGFTARRLAGAGPISRDLGPAAMVRP
ncbi:putative spermidine/putrescine transport system permease protein [Pseudonocardia sediminis]|uniref:Putative spermidine/putrescine transport system permease protein n=1 Tax=Pseudonocardia sediminis TaxID=1397368 RepID=A0A4Q7UQF0_PSEST|nr:putative spermidine/putrescine transport system permease protein [Pseudonocardia sediminis]